MLYSIPVAKYCFWLLFHDHCQQLSTAKHLHYHVPEGGGGERLSYGFIKEVRTRVKRTRVSLRLQCVCVCVDGMFCFCACVCLRVYLQRLHLQTFIALRCRLQHSSTVCVSVLLLSQVFLQYLSFSASCVIIPPSVTVLHSVIIYGCLK